jgi:hypothetical protein
VTQRATETATPPAPGAASAPSTPEQVAERRAAMLAELDDWQWHDEYADAKRERQHEQYIERRARHLRLITDTADESAA